MCTSYFGNSFPTCQQVLGHACHIWYSLWLKSLTHNHSTRAGPVRIHCVMTGVFGGKWKGCASVPKHWTSKIFANFDHWLKRITCWCVTSLTLCRIMAVRKCCTFRLKRKNLLSPTPDACCALLALRSIQLMTGEPRPPVQRAPVTWREWGLWSMAQWQIPYNEITMGVMALKSPASRLFAQPFIEAQSKKHQSSASLAFGRGIHRWPVNSPNKWPVMRKMFPFDDVIMYQDLMMAFGVILNRALI